MACFDFFDNRRLLDVFCRFYNLERYIAVPLIVQASREADPVLYFLQNTNIKLDRISIDDVFLHCKHITTSNDGLESFMRYGLLSLASALSKDTPLKKFLSDNGIEIDVPNMKFQFEGRTSYLHNYHSDCTECFYGSCQFERINWDGEVDIDYKNLHCPFREKTRNLSTKLYTDRAEIEVHLSGNDQEIHGYSAVKRYPEILLTIEEMIESVFGTEVELSKKWQNQQNEKYYCVDFDVNIRDFERITFAPRYERYLLFPYLEFCSVEYDDLPECNPNFYGNIFLISKTITALTEGFHSLYGAILPDVEIPFDRLVIEEHQI